MVPFVFVTGYMVSQSGSVTTLCESLKMFSLPRFWKVQLTCKIKETLLISELKPSRNENVDSEKLLLEL